MLTTIAAAVLAASSAVPPPPDPRLDWWREARFGMFIHWGLYAVPAGCWNGNTGYGEWILTSAQIPVSTYEHFVKAFHPVNFDADAWTKLAHEAGMRYLVVTTKHHDGFCLFDSARTDYDVASTDWGRDVMAELSDACRRNGLRVGWYHSIMDWHHPDYLPRRGWESRSAEGADFDRYVSYLHGQVEELLRNYGPIDVMWFDGEWESTWTHEHGVALYDLVRRVSPATIVNNRVDKGRGGMQGLTTDDRYKGDFGTPEQEVPPGGLPGVDWESCITMNSHWGWNAADTAWKSGDDLVRLLVDVVSKGGNLLLNVGPMADGSFPAKAVDRLKAIGAWMAVNDEAIHGTQASPIETPAWGRCTMKRTADGTLLYLHCFDAEALRAGLRVPGLGNATRRAFALGAPDVALAVARDGDALAIDTRGVSAHPAATVIAVELEGAPIVYETPAIDAPADLFVHELAVTIGTRHGGTEIRYTLDGLVPTAESPRVEGPIVLRDGALVRACAFHDGRPVSRVAERRFSRVEPTPGAPEPAGPAGLRRRIYAGDWNVCPEFEALRPSRTDRAEGVALGAARTAERTGAVLDGWIRIPRDDAWIFELTSDDGSRLLVGEMFVVDNDGLHSTEAQTGVAALGAGWHPIRIEWFNKTGGAELALRVGPVGGPLAEVRPEDLRVGGR